MGDFSIENWLLVAGIFTAVFTGVVAVSTWLNYQLMRAGAGLAKPIKLTKIREISTTLEEAMACWMEDWRLSELRSMRDLRLCLVNQSQVEQTVSSLKCQILWPRSPHLHLVEGCEFTVPPNGGGNFSLRFLDYEWLDLTDKEIEQRRARGVKPQRYWLRVKVETLTGKRENRIFRSTLPLFPDYRIKEWVEQSTDKKLEADATFAQLIREGTGLRGILNETGYDSKRERQFYDDADDWEHRCEAALDKYRGASIAASFSSEGENMKPGGAGDVQDRCNSLWEKLDYLKQLG